MRVVEVIKGDLTAEETMDMAAEWAQGLFCRIPRYVPRVLKDRPEFIANRMAAPASIYLTWAYEQVIAQGKTWEQLNADTWKEELPMDLLELGDYVGHDTYFHINAYNTQTLSPDFQPGEFYAQLVKDGKLGRKSGQGFFDWSKGRPTLNAEDKAGIVTPEELDAIFFPRH